MRALRLEHIQNIYMNRILNCAILAFLLASGTQIQAQSSGSCGSGLEDNALIKQRMLKNQEHWQDRLLPRGGAVNYIPVNIWLMANDNGVGRLSISRALDLLCCLNKSVYNEMDFQFYLNKVFFENRSYVYDDPSSQLGEAYIRSYMLSNKNAINIFVCKVARASDPNVLAFYNPQGDYIVTNKDYVNSNCTTLAHELGHYFSLPHTFYGWEGTDYNSITSNCSKPTPLVVSFAGGTVNVEFVSRDKPGTGGKMLCEQSADGFCDTPADYNLGLGWTGGCNYDGCAKDPDDQKLDPMETNLMSYFLNCISTFTPQQRDAVIKDYLSSDRNYLRRTPAYSPLPEITGQLVYNFPTNTNPPPGFDKVQFDWEDVPNATTYFFEIAENTGLSLNYQSFRLTHSDTVLTNLVKNKTYHWKVTPYNSNSFCLVPRLITFKNPNWTVATDDAGNESGKPQFVLNEVGSATVRFNSEHAQTISLQLVDVKGITVRTATLYANPGINTVQLDALAPGIYFWHWKEAGNSKALSGKIAIH